MGVVVAGGADRLLGRFVTLGRASFAALARGWLMWSMEDEMFLGGLRRLVWTCEFRRSELGVRGARSSDSGGRWPGQRLALGRRERRYGSAAAVAGVSGNSQSVFSVGGLCLRGCRTIAVRSSGVMLAVSPGVALTRWRGATRGPAGSSAERATVCSTEGGGLESLWLGTSRAPHDNPPPNEISR